MLLKFRLISIVERCNTNQKIKRKNKCQSDIKYSVSKISIGFQKAQTFSEFSKSEKICPISTT